MRPEPAPYDELSEDDVMALQAEVERLRKVENDALWLARLACSSSWPLDMAQRVEDAAERVRTAFSGSSEERQATTPSLREAAQRTYAESRAARDEAWQRSWNSGRSLGSHQAPNRGALLAATSAEFAMLRRTLRVALEVAETALTDGVVLDPDWLREHCSIALDHPTEPLVRSGEGSSDV